MYVNMQTNLLSNKTDILKVSLRQVFLVGKVYIYFIQRRVKVNVSIAAAAAISDVHLIVAHTFTRGCPLWIPSKTAFTHLMINKI